MHFYKRFSLQRPIWDYSKVQDIYGNMLRGRKFQVQSNCLRSKLYLNVGCGANIHEDFINIDYQWRPNLDLCWNIVKGIPLGDNSIIGVFTEHCLEHISYSDTCKALLDFRRMLRAGGVVRIVVPDAELYLDIYQRGKLGEEINFSYGHTAKIATDNSVAEPTPMMVVNSVFREHGHLFAYDFITLENMLKKAGFVDIRKESFRQGRDKALLIDSEYRECESLYVEASVPSS